MKIITQNYRNGRLEILDIPMIKSHRGLLVETRASLVSVGTEKAMMEVARKSLLGKALARPDWVRQVVDKIKTEGLREAWRQSQARLDMPVPLGYSSAGIVVAVDRQGCPGFQIGDRVACTGSGYAAHAEYVAVPANLCALIPPRVSFEDAAYGALGGIAMQALRVARIEFGYRVGVIGLGLLGQLAVQLLCAAGCHVLGADISADKCRLAQQHGAEVVVNPQREDAVQSALDFSQGAGLDTVVIFAASSSNEPLEQAAKMCRERGRIVAGGLVGLQIPRKIFFEKELDFVVSRAWGPGVLDPDYEQRQVQWPLAYARWTAQRNLQEFLDLLALGRVQLQQLTTHRFPFAQALQAYELILSGREPAIGVVLQYPAAQTLESQTGCQSQSPREAALESSAPASETAAGASETAATAPEIVEDAFATAGQSSDSVGQKVTTASESAEIAAGAPETARDGAETTGQRPEVVAQGAKTSARSSKIRVGLIGAGLFTRGTLLPAMKSCRAFVFQGIASASGLSSQHLAHKYGFAYATSDYRKLLADPRIDLIFILTRHADHARLVCETLRAGKHVFVEKPLCLTLEELGEIQAVYTQVRASHRQAPVLMVGFNRRFAPTTQCAKEFIGSEGPRAVVQIRCNAGPVPANSWVHHPQEGGGRIIGEVCHFVDLAQFLTNGLPKTLFAACAPSPQGTRDNLCICLRMDNGAAVNITYAANGDKAFPREEVQIFVKGGVFVIDNFKKARCVCGGHKKRWYGLEVDRGVKKELLQTLAAVQAGGPAPIDWQSISATTLATFAIEESIRRGQSVDLATFGADLFPTPP